MRLVSGTGEELGTILGIEHDRHGQPKWLTFLETPHAPPRKVRLEHIRQIHDGTIHLAGPREGYHITRIHG